MLGMDNPLSFFILVEDPVAEAVLKMILTAHNFLLMSETEIFKVGSWKDVIATASALSNSRRTRTVAVIDGNSGDKNRATFIGVPSIFYLPGTEPPEKVILSFAGQYPQRLADELHCSLTSMTIYLAELAGEEHHKWLTRLSERTGQDWQYCLRAAFQYGIQPREYSRLGDSDTKHRRDPLHLTLANLDPFVVIRRFSWAVRSGGCRIPLDVRRLLPR